MKALFVFTSSINSILAQPLLKKLRHRQWSVIVFDVSKAWGFVESLLLQTIWAKRVRNQTIQQYYTSKQEHGKRRSDTIFQCLSKALASTIKLFKIPKPNIIVFYSRPYICEILMLTATQLQIPSLLLAHSGLIGSNYGNPKLFVNKIATMGSFGKQIMVNSGFNPETIVVTGRPIYDTVSHRNPHKKTILYSTDNFPVAKAQEYAYRICKTVKKLPNVRLIIKVHYSERNLDIYHKILRALKLPGLVTQKGDLFKLISLCDVLITGYSTTALDAMVMGKPAVTFNFTDEPSPIPYAESGATWGVHSDDELLEALNQLLFNPLAIEKLRPNWEKFIFDHAYKVDGKACERVIHLMEKMCSSK